MALTGRPPKCKGVDNASKMLFLENLDAARKRLLSNAPTPEELEIILSAQPWVWHSDYHFKNRANFNRPIYNIPENNNIEDKFIQIELVDVPPFDATHYTMHTQTTISHQTAEQVPMVLTYRNDGLVGVAIYLPGRNLNGQKIEPVVPGGLFVADPFCTFFDSSIKIIAKYYPEGKKEDEFFVMPEHWPTLPAGGEILLPEKDESIYEKFYSKRHPKNRHSRAML